MGDYEDLQHKFATAAAADLQPLIRDGAAALGLEGDDVETLGEFVARGWMAGAQAGQAEMVAQAVEQGFHVDHEMIRAPDNGEGSND